MWLLSFSAIACGQPREPEDLEQRRVAFYQQFATSQSSPPTKPDSGVLPARDVPRPYFDPSRQYFFVPPERSGFAVERAAAADPSAGAHDSAIDQRDRRHAASFFDLARQALDAGQGQLAFRLAHEVLRLDPDHEGARRWLGLRRPRDRRAEVTEIRESTRHHPRFGWPAGSYRRVITPHFQISTNDELDTALRLARTLEQLHVVWEQLFFDFWGDTQFLRARAEGQSRAARAQARHQVVMFREREEYVTFVRTLEPQAELTRGYYHAPSRTAYFVGGSEPPESTWRHEVTHQLFHESARASRQIGQVDNFWIVEGVALYMESLQPCREWTTVGGLEAERLQYARFRALREGFYLPLEAFVRLDQISLQRDERIRQLYSQAAGLTHFLLDGQQARFRPAVMRYLRLVYQGRDQHDSLSRLTASSWEQLDRQYHEFLHVNDQQLQWLDPDVQIRQLCLGGTSVSDGGLRSLPSLAHVTWLDLYGLPLTDRGTDGLTKAQKLEQVSLERTQISDPTVARLRTAKGLKQLDLSATQITDAALATLAEFTQLEALWLTGTRISDTGLQQLGGLSQLETLELSGTSTTAAGRAELQRVLPKWRAE